MNEGTDWGRVLLLIVGTIGCIGFPPLGIIVLVCLIAMKRDQIRFEQEHGRNK